MECKSVFEAYARISGAVDGGYFAAVYVNGSMHQRFYRFYSDALRWANSEVRRAARYFVEVAVDKYGKGRRRRNAPGWYQFGPYIMGSAMHESGWLGVFAAERRDALAVCMRLHKWARCGQ